MNQTLIGEEYRLEIPRLTRPIGPDITAPFADLFHAVEALRPPGGSLVLLFAAASGAAHRTAPVASGFARTAERALDLPVLFVDAAGGGAAGEETGGPDLADGFRRGLSPGEIARPTADRQIGWAGFGRRTALGGAEAARLVGALRDSFPVVVIDGGTLGARETLGAGPSLAPALARFADGTVLVARAGRTDAASLLIGRVAIERAGGEVLGAVLDGEETAMPRFLATRL